MKIHVASPSAAVTRTLESLVARAGHSVTDATDAALTLHDDAQLRMIATATGQQTLLPYPLRPAMLQHKLQTYTAPATLQLAHGWRLDLPGRALVHASLAPIPLTEKEAALLKALIEAAPVALDRETLLTQVWGIGSAIDTRTLETHIYRVRSKLGALTPPPCELLTTAGAYRIVMAPEPPAARDVP